MTKRSKIVALAPSVKAWLDRALVEGNFSGYEVLEAELKTRGYAIGKSSIHRYGTNLERRLSAIKASTQAAAAIAAAAPDDAALQSAAVISLIQTEVFDTLVNVAEAQDMDPLERMNVLSKVAKNIATLTRASVGQKKHELDVRDKLAAHLGKIETEAKKGGLSAAEVIARIRGAYGLDAAPGAPA